MGLGLLKIVSMFLRNRKKIYYHLTEEGGAIKLGVLLKIIMHILL